MAPKRASGGHRELKSLPECQTSECLSDGWDPGGRGGGGDGGYGLTGLLLFSWKGNDLSDSDKSREAAVSNRRVYLW